MDNFLDAINEELEELDNDIEFDAGNRYIEHINSICYLCSEFDKHVFHNLTHTIESKVKDWSTNEHLSVRQILCKLIKECKEENV